VHEKELKEFLDENKIKYVTVMHSSAYTAQEVAALTHTKGKDFAKTVMVMLDGTLAMAVVPASYQVNLMQLKEGTQANTVALASESEFRARFPGCETGAMPPFGNLFDMTVFVDESLTKDLEISFNAGSHNELIRLLYEDFERLVKPKVLKFAGPDAQCAVRRIHLWTQN
jgi:Ala-tRNA(Pro) deacylase